MEQKIVDQWSLNRWFSLKNLLFDGVAVLVIILGPAMAHLLTFPLYYLEPMRLMLILALVHTTKKNGYLLALILPFCSWIFSGHPEFIKMLVITIELVVNVTLFYWFNSRFNKPFAAMLASILGSKILCYMMYWVVFSTAFLKSEAGLFFILIQIAVSVVFSLYVYFLMRQRDQHPVG